MEDNGTDLNNVLNDQPEPRPADITQEPRNQADPGELSAEPPAARHQEAEHVPRAALVDERRKRQELEQRVAAYEHQQQMLMQQQAQQRQQQSQPPQQGLSPSQFETYEQYLEAVAEAKAEAKARQVFEATMQQAAQRQHAALVQQQTAADLTDMLSAGRSKYPDFDEVVGAPHVPITDTMMHTMMAIDAGHEVGYHLGKNPAEAARIARLPASGQAREIAKLAKQLAAPAPAPAPAQVNLPKTLTQSRSASGQFAAPAYDGPTPLNDILGK